MDNLNVFSFGYSSVLNPIDCFWPSLSILGDGITTQDLQNIIREKKRE